MTKRTVLLDLNYTLAICDFNDKRSLAQRIPTEEYRTWIPELLVAEGAFVILTTARPTRWEAQTLARIADQCDGWQPDEVEFSTSGSTMPHIAKTHNLERIIARHGQPDHTWLGLESNPRTRTVYAKYGFESLPVPKEGRWLPGVQEVVL